MSNADTKVFQTSLLPDYGPLEIESLQDFLNKSRKDGLKLFCNESLIVKGALKLEDLDKVTTIGVGSFGTVMQVKDSNGDLYALKAIDKRHIVKTKQVKHILNEKNILSVIDFPFIVRLVAYFSDNSYVYFVMPFYSGGDLFALLRRFGRFDEGLARFYAAQIALGLEYLHFLDIIYRDLKPENILVDHTGYIKLTDFGFSKYLKYRTWTMCGTPEYLAPEMMLNKGYSKAVDWWAYGVIIFELVSGRSPFFAKDPLRVYEKILAARYVFPVYVSPECKGLVRSLLQTNISLRYGSLKKGVADIKEHAWFRPVEWHSLLNRRLEPPYVPPSKQVESNFEPCKDINLKVSHTNRFEKEFELF